MYLNYWKIQVELNPLLEVETIYSYSILDKIPVTG